MRSIIQSKIVLCTSLTALLLVIVQSTLVGQTSRKTASAILLDNTGSMRLELLLEQEIAKQLVTAIFETGPVSVFHFAGGDRSPGSRAKVLVGADWGKGAGAIGSSIDGIFTVPGQTTLIDAIYFAAEKVVAKVEQDKLAEGVLYVVTDGEDRASERKADELFKYLAERKIKVRAVGLVRHLSTSAGFITASPARKGKSFLKNLAQKSEGRVVFPDQNQSATEIVEELLAPAPAK